jgi:hypothetical protein
MESKLSAKDLVLHALESTVYIEPDQIGLTRNELDELAERFGFKKGEISDVINQESSSEHLVSYFRDPFIYPG